MTTTPLPSASSKDPAPMAPRAVQVAAGSPDPFADFKAKQRESWSRFAPLEAMTTPPAARLVHFAGIKPGQSVLDVGCGTGVVALTAARAGATVTGLDLTPELLERAKENAAIARLNVTWKEGDAEALPYPDASFDVVTSQFGHIFAPRAEVAVAEMLRVLKPGGRLAFATWPPELAVGKLFAVTGRYLPPPAGVTPPALWGDPAFVRDKLGPGVRDVAFDRATALVPTLSVPHYRTNMEATAGPVIRIVESLRADAAKLQAFRTEVEGVIAPYFRDNYVHQDFLLTRATKG